MSCIRDGINGENSTDDVTYIIGGFLDDVQLIDVEVFGLSDADEVDDELRVVDVMYLGFVVSVRPVVHALVLYHTAAEF